MNQPICGAICGAYFGLVCALIFGWGSEPGALREGKELSNFKRPGSNPPPACPKPPPPPNPPRAR